MEIYELKARVKKLNISIAYLDRLSIEVLSKLSTTVKARDLSLQLEAYNEAKEYDKEVIKWRKETNRLHDAIVLMSQERSELGKKIQRMRQEEYEERMRYNRMIAMMKAKQELELANMRRGGWIIVNGESV